jgi:hypothetical protein
MGSVIMSHMMHVDTARKRVASSPTHDEAEKDMCWKDESDQANVANHHTDPNTTNVTPR